MNSCLIVAGFFVVTYAFGGSSPDESYVIKRAPKVGQLFKYDQTGTFELGGVEVQVSSKSNHKVLKVEDTQISLEIKRFESKVSVNGSEQTQPDTTRTSIERLNGELLELGTQTGPEAYRAPMIMAFIYPDKPVAIGGTWSFDGKATSKGAVDLHIDFKLIGVEKIGTHNVLKIEGKGKEKITGSPASAESTIWVDKETGVVVKQVVKVTDVVMPGAPGLLSGKMSRTLVD